MTCPREGGIKLKPTGSAKIDPLYGNGIPLDAVVIPGLMHRCPFHSGNVGSWRCNLISRPTKSGAWREVRCPENYREWNVSAPSDCPLRTAEVTIRKELLD